MQYSATASTGATVTFAIETLPQAFAHIPDPRRVQGTRCSVAAILSLAVVALLANHTSVLAMAEWAARQTRHVRRALGFERHSTASDHHCAPLGAARSSCRRRSGSAVLRPTYAWRGASTR